MNAPTNPTPINLTVASNQADASAVEAVEQHHAQLAGELAALVEALLAAVSSSPGSAGQAADVAQQRLVDFCTSELVPHAEAEEQALYPVAAQDIRAKLLVESMIAEHRMLRLLVDELADTTRPVLAAALALALRVLFDVHLAKENELILPLIAADPRVSLAQILGGMHELLGHAADGCGHDGGGCGDGCGCGHGDADDHGCGHGASDPVAGAVANDEQSGGCNCGCGGHSSSDEQLEPVVALAEFAPDAAAKTSGGCGCGEHGEGESPVLDVREIPHAIRHATVFGAVAAVPSKASLILVAPHDPLPLLAQLEAREPNAWTVNYEQRGPEAWRLRLTRA